MYRALSAFLASLSLSGVLQLASAHEGTHWSPPSLDWSNEQIEAVIGFPSGRVISIEGKECLAGTSLFFKVRDRYAFDIDETVWLSAQVRAPGNAPITLSYDGPTGMSRAAIPLDANPDQKVGWQRVSLPMPHARFANLGFLESDFAIYAPGEGGQSPPQITVCDLSIKRTHTTPQHRPTGSVSLEITDERGQKIPARLGLYDSSGRLPLPGDEALLVRPNDRPTRVIRLGPASVWPVTNRMVFYSDGAYHTRIPVGEYELIATRGLEYRLARQRFSIAANQTKAVRVVLQRWTDMAAKGWYSGEDHIHHTRGDAKDDHSLGVLGQAEDLRVSNILRMGNLVRTYFEQHEWQTITTDRQGQYLLVSGQEDPRTSHRGHTLSLNLRTPVRDPARYLLYHELFAKVHAQGGLTGYAHVTDPKGVLFLESNAAMTGMAIDMPFGLVDFCEVMTGAYWGDEIWFDFLNLGYKLAPSAGSDYPYIDIPGAARNYVRLEGAFGAQAWFDGLKKGRVFVTSGPMLDFTVNGMPMGSEIQIAQGESLTIEAHAAINPDIDELASLELIEQGEAVKHISPNGAAFALSLRQNLRATHGTWFVVRARGKNPNVVALSAPIYVLVDGQSFWKPAAIPGIVTKLKRAMGTLLQPRRPEATEIWETQDEDIQYWASQQGPLKARIEEASARYDDLVQRDTAVSRQVH